MKYSQNEQSFFVFQDLPGIGQTIELLTVPAPSEASTTTFLPSQSQQSAEILLQELTSLIQQPIDTKSSMHIAASSSRQARTANTYGGTSLVGGNRPGTAVKSTITPSGGAPVRKPFQQQTMNDDRMFFGRPTTIGQGQYHNRTGLMSNKQQQSITPSVSLGQPSRVTPEHHQQSSQRRPLSWFQ
jgi:hypothetical protein